MIELEGSTPPDSPTPPAAPPALDGTVVVRESLDDVIDAVAGDLFMQACACVRAFGDFHLALSGGSTPQPLYRRLMYDPNYRDLPWKRTHLWIVDERVVPFDDDRSNFKMIRELIVEHSAIPPEQVHPIPAMLAQPDLLYEQEIRENLGWRERGHDRLDFALLGMGADAHTASLFPHSPALNDRERLVLPNAGPTVTPPDRVTMTLHMINASRLVAVLVTGPGKRQTIARLVRERPPAREAPIMGVRPLGGELRWYLDRAACPDASEP